MIISGNSNINKVYYSGYTISKVYACGGELVYEKEIDKCDQYFTIVAKSDGSVHLSTYKLPQEYQYSKDGGLTWTTIRNADETPTESIQVSSGESVMFKGELEVPTTIATLGVARVYASMPSYEVRGNVMSLVYGDNFRGQTTLPNMYAIFDELFRGCSGLTSAGDLCLPATTLRSDCYAGMFMDCTNLVEAPELPATTLASHCYGNMFAGCTSLTTAPQLSATTLVTACYGGMFIDCTNLVEAPELPATTLSDYCYSQMFQNCSNLNKIVCLAEAPLYKHTGYWVSGVSSGGTFVKSPQANWETGVSGIPSGWSVINKQ